jgi:hypothetical protein
MANANRSHYNLKTSLAELMRDLQAATDARLTQRSRYDMDERAFEHTIGVVE